jgi:hypothetical protein
LSKTPVGTFSAEAPSATPLSTAENVSSEPSLDIKAIGLLENNTCDLPCWYGIHPGQSTLTDTLPILEPLNVKLSEPIIIDWPLELYGFRRASFTWKKELEYKWYPDGSVEFSGHPLQVFEIYFHNYFIYTLQDFIDILGEPSHIQVWAEPCFDQDCNNYGVRIFFYEHGVSLHQSITGLEPIEFSASWVNFNISLFDNSPLGFSRYMGKEISVVEVADPWRGFLGFDAYCKGEGCSEE